MIGSGTKEFLPPSADTGVQLTRSATRSETPLSPGLRSYAGVHHAMPMTYDKSMTDPRPTSSRSHGQKELQHATQHATLSRTGSAAPKAIAGKWAVPAPLPLHGLRPRVHEPPLEVVVESVAVPGTDARALQPVSDAGERCGRLYGQGNCRGVAC